MLELFIRRSVLVNMLMVGMIIAGIVYYRANIKEQMPEVAINAAWISTAYPGVSATDIESLVTRPIEDAIKGVEGIETFNSTSTEGRSFIWVEFRQDVESMAKAVLDLQNQVNLAELPEEIDDPRVGQGKSRHPAAFVTLAGGTQPPRVLREVARDLIEKLEDLDDVGQVSSGGLQQRQVEVRLRPDKLEAHRVAVGEVVAALQTRKRDVPGGNVQAGRDEYTVRALAELRSTRDISQIVVRPGKAGQHVTIDDLATVSDTFADPVSAARVDGGPGVVLVVRKEQGGDILRLSAQVNELLAKYREQLPAGMRLKLIGSAAREVRQGLATLYGNGALGTVLVLLCLWLFLGGRNALMASLGLPVALLGGVLVMYLLGITINIVALFALILCVGIVVDDAIVIIENIYRHLEEGATPLRAALDGTREVMWPVISSVLTTCAAFLPLLLMTGTMGQFFSIIPKVVVAALAASLIEALIILPSHMADLGRVQPTTRLQRTRARARAVAAWYRRVLVSVLRRPVVVSVGALLVCAALVGSALQTKEVVLLADEDIQTFDVRVQMPSGTPLEQTMAALARVEQRVLAGVPTAERQGVVSVGGWSRTRMWPKTGKHLGMVTTVLVPTRDRERRGIEILNHVRERLGDIAGPVKIEVVQVVLGPPKGRPVAVRLSGERFERLKRLAEKVAAELRRLPGVSAIADDYQPGKREVRVRLDPARGAMHGLSHLDIGGFIRSLYGGFPATKLRDGDEELDVVVRHDPALRRDPRELAATLIGTRAGQRVALGDVARVEQGRAVAEIHRRDRKRTITVTAEIVAGQTTASAVNRALAARLTGLRAANPDVKFVFGGEWEKTSESLKSLLRAAMVAALLIFTILAAQFRSVSQPLVVLLAIPLSLIGVVTGFFVSGDPVGMIALIGVVGLAGIAVNDSTVLIDFVNTRRRGGASRDDAVVEACVLRLRPVLLTSITTIAGLLPLALGWGGSSESLRPMALAIVWGLGFCTVLTLLVVPCLYVTITRLAEWLVPGFVRRAFNRHEP